MAEKWYNLTPEQVEARLSTDMQSGLGPKQAAARLRREGKNTVYRVERPRTSVLMRDVLRDPCAYMLIAAAVLAWIFNERVGAPLVIALTLFNMLFVLGAYLKARNVISDTHEYTIPTATVIRAGKQYLIKQDRLCRGDVILLTKGDVVPCDARVIEAEGLCVLEVALTGETQRKRKAPKIIFGNNLPPEKQTDMVFATSVVVKGQGKAIVCETGEDTFAACLGKTEPKEEKSADLGVLETLRKHCASWSLIMLIMVFVLTLADFIVGFESRSIFNIFITGLSIATAGMCEYYLVFGYIIIGTSMYGMLRRERVTRTGAVVKDIGNIDKLAGITTLIVPKEGAFTAGAIRLKKIYCDSVLLSPDEKHLDNTCPHLISAALDTTCYTENDYEKVYNRFKARDVSVEEKAILSLATQSGIFDGPVYMGSHILVDRRIEDDMTRSVVAVNGNSRLALRGKAEDILPMCSSYRSSEAVKNIKQEKKRINNLIKALLEEGLYTVCIATRETDDITASSGLVFEGFLALNQPQLAGTKENITRIQKAGINLIMLSDDSSSRVYAKALGVIDTDDEIMTGRELNGMTDDLFRTNASVYHLYEGLTVPQKRLLISHLQQNGESVGYFGCNFDEMILVREADVGFASGVTLNRGNSTVDLGSENAPVFIRSGEEKGSGCEALKQVCDVIVSPADGKGGGFNAITSAIAQSRLAFRSLYRMVRYLVTSQCARLFVFLYSTMVPVTGIPFCGEDIFTPVQLLILGLIFDLGVVMAFAFRSSKGDIVSGEERGSTVGAVLFGIFWGVCALVFPAILRLCGITVTNTAMSSMVFFGFMLTQVTSAVEIINDTGIFKRGFISNLRAVAATIVTAAFIGVSAYTASFNTCMLTPMQWGIMLLQPLCMLAVYEIYKLVKGRNDDTNKED